MNDRERGTSPPTPSTSTADHYAALLDVARDVISDYGIGCDDHAACACSMGRLARLVYRPGSTEESAT